VDAWLDLYPNFYVDTSARIGEIGCHPAEEVRAFFMKHQDRALFGTDLMLGWEVPIGENEGELGAIERFYGAHWRYFETDRERIAYPGFPIQGRWKVDAASLPDEILQKLYAGNAQRLIPGLQT